MTHEPMGCAVYLSGPPVPLLAEKLLRFPVRGAEVAVAVTADDGIVGEDGRHDADSLANHCFLCKESLVDENEGLCHLCFWSEFAGMHAPEGPKAGSRSRLNSHVTCLY